MNTDEGRSQKPKGRSQSAEGKTSEDCFGLRPRNDMGVRSRNDSSFRHCEGAKRLRQSSAVLHSTIETRHSELGKPPRPPRKIREPLMNTADVGRQSAKCKMAGDCFGLRPRNDVGVRSRNDPPFRHCEGAKRLRQSSAVFHSTIDIRNSTNRQAWLIVECDVCDIAQLPVLNTVKERGRCTPEFE